jgi:hypothetical protein
LGNNVGKYILYVSLLMVGSQSFANAVSCPARPNLFESTGKSVREVKNAILRLTNLKYGFNSLITTYSQNGRSQTVVFLFEKPGNKSSVIEMVKEEIDYLNATVHVAPKIQNGTYVLADNFLNVDTNLFNRPANPAAVDSATTQRAQSIRGDERRLVKFFAGAVSFLPTAIFSAISFAIDMPGKEFVIPAVTFASAMGFRHFAGAIDKHYNAKPLDAQREVDLDENRDVTSIYPYEIVNRLNNYLRTEGSTNDIHVLVMPGSLEGGIKEHMPRFSNFREMP